MASLTWSLGKKKNKKKTRNMKTNSFGVAVSGSVTSLSQITMEELGECDLLLFVLMEEREMSLRSVTFFRLIH